MTLVTIALVWINDYVLCYIGFSQLKRLVEGHYVNCWKSDKGDIPSFLSVMVLINNGYHTLLA